MIAALQIIIKEVVEVLVFDRTTRFAAVYIARSALIADITAYLFGFEAALSASAAYTLSFILMP